MNNLHDPKVRLEQEYEELTFRIDEIDQFIDSRDYQKLSFSNQQLLIQQSMTMHLYLNILGNRLVLWEDIKKK